MLASVGKIGILLAKLPTGGLRKGRCIMEEAAIGKEEYAEAYDGDSDA